MIHSHAYIEDSQVGDGTTVWQFASVIRNAKVGVDCNIGASAVIDNCIIGNRCLIGALAFIPPGIVIEDDVFIGPNVSFCNDVWPSVDKTNFYVTAPTIIVKFRASIGAAAVVLPGVTIGEGAVVAANATVQYNVPEYHLLRRDGHTEPLPAKRERIRLAK